MSENVLHIDLSPTKMTDKREKVYKSAKLEEIISAVCALLNSGGGELNLHLDSDNISSQQVDNCVKTIEQRLAEMTGVTRMAGKIKIVENPKAITFSIGKANKLVTVKTNFYLPTTQQVNVVPATESLGEFIRMTETRIGEHVAIGSHEKRFVKEQNSGLHEDVHIQLKHLKASSSNGVTLADRITGTSNKLMCYVSAFANHCGGSIYYGINDSRIVEGETIPEKLKDDIVKKVTKTINKMIWPKTCSKPERGTQWDIFFEPVVDVNDDPIPSTFVVVISIATCLGGVFTEEPESYHIIKNKVEKMSFHDWSTKIAGVSTAKSTQTTSLLSNVSRVTWSSPKNKEIFRLLSEKLIEYRNDQDMDSFRKLSTVAKQNLSGSNVEQIVIAEEVMVAFKNGHFCKADALLASFEKSISSSKDSLIFEARFLELKSMIDRSTGNYEASYETAQQGLQILQLAPVGLYTIWLCIKAAIAATIILAEEHNVQQVRFHKDAVRKYLEVAARDANQLEDHHSKMSDLQQKLRFYKVWFLLGCSNTGEIVKSITPSCDDIEAAAEELASVSRSILKGCLLTHYRQVQYHMAECDLFRRRSEIFLEENCKSNLNKAFECGSRARDLAKQHHFEIMVDYASKRLADITEKLVRHNVSEQERSTPRSFLGFEY